MAMDPKAAQELYISFQETLQKTHDIPTKIGRFGEHMNIMLTNDGPVTILMESKER